MYLKKNMMILSLLITLFFTGCGSDESKSETKALDKVDLSKYSSVYVYKKTTLTFIEELKNINQNNNDFYFNENLFSCEELTGYIKVSKDDIKKYVEQLEDKDLIVGDIVAVYTTLNFDNLCMEIDLSKSKNAGSKNATLSWNR